MIGHKTSLNQFKGIEIIFEDFYICVDVKLEINYRKENRKKINMRLNNMLLKN